MIENNNLGGVKNRDYGVDVLKCFAALLITWSHMEKPLGDFSMLATGGSLGDALFFFCSGYTLFLSNRCVGFFNWYKKRINRIYPTVFAWALFLCVFGDSSKNLLNVILTGGGWFISYIMLFYLLFYPIKKYLSEYLGWALLISLLLLGGGYFLVDHSAPKEETSWLYCSFFCVMLLGGIAGKCYANDSCDDSKTNMFRNFIGVIFCFIGYYIFSFIEDNYNAFVMLRPVNIIVIGGFAYYMFLFCRSKLIRKCYQNGKAIILTVGGLCLEIYLVQSKIITDKLNGLFPFNIILIYLGVIVCAYILRCTARLWAQTFKDGDYDLKGLTKLY